MNTAVIETVVYLPPTEVFEFLVDFPRYSRYSKYLTSVERDGDGGPGTAYRLRFQWWKLGYTAHTRVTEVEPPERLAWEVTRDLDAHGRWEVEEVPDAVPSEGDRSTVPVDAETASRVRLVVSYDSDSADSGLIDLPLFVSFDWLVGGVTSLVVEEGERVVERMVADLEGERRPVELAVETR